MYHHFYREAVLHVLVWVSQAAIVLRIALTGVYNRHEVYCALRAEALNQVSSIPGSWLCHGSDSPRPLATEARVRSLLS